MPMEIKLTMTKIIAGGSASDLIAYLTRLVSGSLGFSDHRLALQGTLSNSVTLTLTTRAGHTASKRQVMQLILNMRLC